MALIEIDGLPWLTVLNSMVDLFMANCECHNQVFVCVNSGEAETSATSSLGRPGLQWFGSAA